MDENGALPKYWDVSQREVINAPHEDRLLVGAGPGTGKTAVACARVSQLIDLDGLEPSRIWLISFTRTAVREIRNRIAADLEDTAAAYAVKIATLDSHAWTIHSGFDEEAKILDTYEENIERVLDLVRQDENVGEYLQTVEHLVVDEAQDIVGIRADLVIEIIRKLSSSCGVTVFADEAQAIYDFADDREPGEVGKPPLLEKIRSGAAAAFSEYELTQVHRTSSPQLLKIFSDTRRMVLAVADENGDKLAKIKHEVSELAHGKVPDVDDAVLAELEDEDAFILYRKRCDVLMKASKFTQDGISHRVRMSGLPVCLAPWIGAALSEHTDANLSRDRFMKLWDDRVHDTSLATCKADNAWAHLVRIAGQGRTHKQAVVEMRLLRQRLSRKQPAAELCNAELGLHGPIVGTIHASKGREADTVSLMLPDKHGGDVDQDEESRVVFVGATRARLKLLIGSSPIQFAGKVEDSGRAYRLLGRQNAQVEIGRDSDIKAEGLACRSHFASSDEVRDAQTRIRSFADETLSLVAETDRNNGFLYRLKENGQGQCLAVLSKTVNNDLFTVAKAIQAKLYCGKLRPPNIIPHLHVRGVRSIVLPPEESETLYEPWRISGIMLAPLVLGYSKVFFPFARRQGSR